MGRLGAIWDGDNNINGSWRVPHRYAIHPHPYGTFSYGLTCCHVGGFGVMWGGIDDINESWHTNYEFVIHYNSHGTFSYGQIYLVIWDDLE